MYNRYYASRSGRQSRMRYIARDTAIQQLGRKEWKKCTSVKLNLDRAQTGHANESYWYEDCLFLNNEESNPFYTSVWSDRYYSKGASMKYDMVNNNVFPIKVIIREIGTKYNSAYDMVTVLSKATSEGGMGTTYYDDRDADPNDSVLFSRLFNINYVTEYIILAGRSWSYDYKARYFGQYGTTIGSYMWSGATNISQFPVYTKGVHFPILMQFVPMPQTGYSAGETPVTAEIRSGPIIYLGILRTIQYKWVKLQDNASSLDYSRTSGPETQPLFSRAPGSLDARVNNSSAPPTLANMNIDNDDTEEE